MTTVRRPTPKEIGAFIRHHRIARGLTQGELGAMVGCGISQVCDYERGRFSPIGDTLLALFKALDAPQFTY
jgi:transcriptional regulator with XRE-family HTH domain